MLFLQELFTAIETGNVEHVQLILRLISTSSTNPNKGHSRGRGRDDDTSDEDDDDNNKGATGRAATGSDSVSVPKSTSAAHSSTSPSQAANTFVGVNQRLLPRYDMTPLHLAVGLDSAPIVKLLLAHGADPNCLNCAEAVTPLHLSVLYELESMVKILLEAGGDPNLVDGEQKSCFDLAVENGAPHLVEFLRAKRFDPEDKHTEPTKKVERELKPDLNPKAKLELKPEVKPEVEILRKASRESHSPFRLSLRRSRISRLDDVDEDDDAVGIDQLVPPGSGMSDTDAESFYSCYSANTTMLQTKASRMSKSRQSRTPKKSILETVAENENEKENEGRDSSSSNSTSPTTSTASSHEVWLPEIPPGYSYLLTDDDSTDADRSADTTMVGETSATSSTSSTTPSPPRPPMRPRVRAVSPKKSTSPRRRTPAAPIKVPTPEELRNLAAAVQKLDVGSRLRVPVTPTTFPLLARRLQQTQTGNGNAANAVAVPSKSQVLKKASRSPTRPGPVPAPAIASGGKTTNPNTPKVPLPVSALQFLRDPTPAGPNNFSPELQASLQNLELIHSWGNLKVDLIQSLTPTKRTAKSFYNYLLLDPKIIKRANFSGNHLKSDIIKNTEKFERFLASVFYVGKGNGNRPIAHLVEARHTLLESQSTKRSARVQGQGQGPIVAAGTGSANGNGNNGEKVAKILQIWKSGQGVILHSMFHHSAERETNINEAAMIDAIGLNFNNGDNNGNGGQLTNLKKGSYLGTGAVQWSQKAKNQFGAFLLYKCFCSFVVTDAKVFFPQDV